MERKEFIFDKACARTYAFCTAMPETYVLLHAEGLRGQKYKVYGGTYSESSTRELTAKDDYELFVPREGERLVSFSMSYSPEIKCRVFIGALHDLFLAEFFLSNRRYNRSGFQYTKRELTYSENSGTTFLGIYLEAGVYKLSIAATHPYRMRQDIQYKPGSNAFKLIEWFFGQMKMDPPVAQVNVQGGLSNLLAKYFPAQPYKAEQSGQKYYRHG